MFTYYIDWPQAKTWEKDFPPEINFLYTLGDPGRNSYRGIGKWNYFGTPTTIQINIYDEEAIILFKLKFGSSHNF